MTGRILVAAALGLALAGCGARGGGGGADLEASLAAEGLRLEGFAAVDATAFGATRCRGGRVEGVHAVLCELAGDDALRRARHAADGFIGEAATGLVLDRRSPTRALLVLADRDHVDPSGRAMKKIARAFAPTDGKRR
jgi:hypothetical protein